MAKSSGKSGPFKTVVSEVNQSPDLRRHLLIGIESHFKSKVVSFFTSFARHDAQILDDDAEMLESILSSEHDGGPLILIINSPGGQALAAERIVNVCRAYSRNRFEVIVPHMAKSAATMICFGAAAIHMAPTAELGPVDPQVPFWADGVDPEEDPPIWISAEEYVRSYEVLLDRASNGKAKRLEPFIQQLSRFDARYIEKLKSIQRLSTDISVRLLQSLMMKKVPAKTIKSRVDVFLSQTRTSSHGRMISYAEARDCGLKVKMIDLQSPVWHSLWELFVRSDWAVSHKCRKIMETSESAVFV